MNDFLIKLKKFFKREINLQTLAPIAGVVAMLALGTAALNIYVAHSTSELVFDEISDIPANEYGLILGISSNVNQRENLYFSNRIRAAVQLYNQGKIKYIIVSGSNYPKYNYSEPKEMKKALIEKGIPESRIIKDEHGFRTVDSIRNAKEYYGLDKFTIISQKFHNTRAVFIARFYALDTVAFNALEDNMPIEVSVNHLREYLAKVRMLFDFVTHPELPDDSRSTLTNLAHILPPTQK
ncbi:MAG: hypothetical protein GY750_18975 [Lentisphaerae bacterium]|nr:hypothetical protein [Lentisphaerota bacterium]MCP4103482.1 hypothetical protein [Lentisphaerota bacterium]